MSVSSDATSECFPPEARIRRGVEYRALRSRGQRFHSRDIVFLYRSGETLRSRVGITVSRRVGNAVVRNRIKRWVREFARRRMGSLPRAWDVVIIARRSAGGALHRDADDQMGEFFDYLATR